MRRNRIRRGLIDGDIKGTALFKLDNTVKRSGKDVTRLASMCKLKAGRLAREVTDSCLQYWGGMGYMWETPVARFWRDSRLVSIGGGADEVMLGIISKFEGTLPKRKPA